MRVINGEVDRDQRQALAVKKIAVLCIAATNQPVYVHYIQNYWTALIRHTNAVVPNIDVYLLFEQQWDIQGYSAIRENIIVDPTTDFDRLCEPKFQTNLIPGILSKTVYALDLLKNDYDVFFRTNLSSLLKLSDFDRYVQDIETVSYSGNLVWPDSLRDDLIWHDRVGTDKSIKTLSELDHYEGNSFASGSGYFLSAEEAKVLIESKDRIRFDIIDDVAMGLMFKNCEILQNFSLILDSQERTEYLASSIKHASQPHIRLEQFPLEAAEALWDTLKNDDSWK